ncbi:protein DETOXIFICATION 55-like [Oryza brachyantha]|uniref:protein DETOXIFICATION 55-like n=1 Tax=Oryza brachyantha TaxID=4533 RepID=UPI001ADC9086|nr:protein DETOXIFICATION 55-like [Oryza brachyantha]
MVLEERHDHAPNHISMSEVMEELKLMRSLCLPISALNLLHYVKSMVTVLCMGLLGRDELAGGALAVGLTNVTGYSVLSGLALGLEPVAGQAFGSGNPGAARRALRRAVLLLLAASLPVAALWACAGRAMRAAQQDAAVARVAGSYCRYAIPDLAATSVLLPARVYLRSKGEPGRLTSCMALAVALHVPATVYLGARLRVPGVAMATCATNLATLAFLWISLTWAGTAQKEPDEPTGSAEWADMAHFSEWAQLLRLSLPSCLSVCLEWWWYELMTITAGYLRDPAATLAAAAIVIQTTSLLYTISVTLSSAVSARVAYELGAGRPRSAHVSFVVAMGLAMVGSCVGLAWATLGRRPWVHVFTDDPTVQSLAASVLPVVGLCELANCPQTTGCGVLRGSARPVVGAAINLCSFYLVGAPVALVLAFGLDMGFLGLCLGLLSAQVVCLLCVGFATFQTDWEAEALKAFHLVGSGDDKGGLAQKENV